MSLLGSHYEVLGIDPRASLEQVERAHRFTAEMYADDSLATYSLLDPEERSAARARVEEAYATLRDPIRRYEYDVSLGLAVPGAPVLPLAGPPAVSPSATTPVAALSAPPSAALSPQGLPPTALGVLPEPVTGAALKAFRESRGVRLRDIADASKIGIRFLEYIEQERYPFLPAAVYLRSFLQEYARAVGLDPRRTAESYMVRVPKHGT